jgi:hypothetical protein
VSISHDVDLGQSMHPIADLRDKKYGFNAPTNLILQQESIADKETGISSCLSSELFPVFARCLTNSLLHLFTAVGFRRPYLNFIFGGRSQDRLLPP